MKTNKIDVEGSMKAFRKEFNVLKEEILLSKKSKWYNQPINLNADYHPEHYEYYQQILVHKDTMERMIYSFIEYMQMVISRCPQRDKKKYTKQFKSWQNEITNELKEIAKI